VEPFPELDLASLAAAQDDVCGRGQLRSFGIDADRVRNAVRAGRWQTRGRRVVVLHSGPLSESQRLWAAVLGAGDPPCALTGLTAARLHGLRGFDTDVVHVVVRHGKHIRPTPGVAVHVSRRLSAADLHPVHRPPMVRRERALVDAAMWSPCPRLACAVLAAAVQQRLTTATRLRAELLRAGAVRLRRILLLVLGDIEGGAHSLSEIDFGSLCRCAGLPDPVRQEIRLDRNGGRRYLDAVLRRPDGTTFAVEVDGAVHLLAGTYWDDMDRGNELTIAGEQLLRFPSVAIRLDPDRVVDQLRRMAGLRADDAL
jgi:hypothetical protein